MNTRRVVITGMGAVSPAGMGVSVLWERLIQARVCIGPLTRLDSAFFGLHVAGEVPSFAPERYMDKKEARRMDRFSQFAMAAAAMAVEQSGLDFAKIDSTRAGVIVGSGIGGMETIEREHEKLLKSDSPRVTPLLVPMIIGNMAAGNIAIRYGLGGICSCEVTACSSGTHSIGTAFRAIKHGYADVMLAGASEAPITALAVAGFLQLSALTTATDPLRASIPFDAERAGFVIGEGAGMLVLESLESAQQRGAEILGEIVGFGSTGDGYHMTAPRPDGQGAARAMRDAMLEGGIAPEQVGYINAHGTGTQANDGTETRAIKSALGEAASSVAVSSTKSCTGHLLGAAGAVEAILSVQALRDSWLPPTLGYRVPDPECDLDIVPNQGRFADIEYALSNSLGFGGHNATLAMRRYSGE